MDQLDGVAKARQFTRTRYTGEIENIVRDHERKRALMRSQMAARGMLQSSNMIVENARIDGDQIKAMIEARLDAMLEGYELTVSPSMIRWRSTSVMTSFRA